MFDPLLRAWLAHERGEQPQPRRLQGAPPHLSNLHWRFLCECGTAWHRDADAVWRDGDWRGPTEACLICHRTVEGCERQRE